MKKIMMRAWEIYRTLTGDHKAKIACALRQAWAEAKATTEKERFEKAARIVIEGREHYDDDQASKFTYFNAWEKYGKRRIYVNDYKRRTIGYIDRDTKQFMLSDNNGLTSKQIAAAVDSFTARYAF